MKNPFNFAMALGTLCGIALSASAADIPPNIVKSDTQDNTAMGSGAMGVSTSGSNNTAAGAEALDSDFMGNDNSAFGTSALTANGGGNNNTAVGYEALLLSQGNNNIGIGASAGVKLQTGSNDIYVGNGGGPNESGHIRIGVATLQKLTFIAGISGTAVTGGVPVVVSSAGQLGVATSSERYKTGIAPMGSDTEKLRQLRPVRFHYKADAQGPVQYGLIAEEVAKIYPELVFRDDAGVIQGVHYEELAPMLLNEVQKQATRLSALQRENAALKQQQAKQSAEVAQLHDLERQVAQIRAAMAALPEGKELVASR